MPPATAFISQSSTTARELASRVAYVHQEAPVGAAAVALGQARPEIGEDSVPCAGGGEVDYVAAGSNFTATYAACDVGDYTFSGTATVTMTEANGELQSYVIDFTNSTLAVTDGPNGFTGTLAGGGTSAVVTCTAADGGAFSCVAGYRQVNWGNDFEYDYVTAIANGSTGCRCGASNIVNVEAIDLGATSGSAEITGREDSAASVTRSGTQAFDVELTSGDTTENYSFTDVVALP